MSEPLYTHDCRNGHHGAFCGMTPCDCLCHANERPAAPEVGRCGDASPSFIGAPPDICTLPAGHAGWHRGDPPLHGRAPEWSTARPAAPDATAGDGLREAIARAVRQGDTTNRYGAEAAADAVLALPALRDVLAAAARDAEKVRRVEELARVVDYDTRQRIRHALDGTT